MLNDELIASFLLEADDDELDSSFFDILGDCDLKNEADGTDCKIKSFLNRVLFFDVSR